MYFCIRARHFAIAIDVPRCAHIVRDGIGKGLQLFGVDLHDTVFQRCAQAICCSDVPDPN